MRKESERLIIQNENFKTSSKEVRITLFLSDEKKIHLEIPVECTIQMVKSMISKKVREIQNEEIVGYETIPEDYLFDYRFSKNIGTLDSQQINDLTLKCLFKKSPDDSVNYEKQFQNKYAQTLLNSSVKLCKYKICRPLSSGGFSRVYLVRNLQNGQFYAAKFMDKSSQVNVDREEAIKNQFYIHKSLDHPFIVKMEQFIETQHFYILILEYCPGGELFTLLKNNRYMGQTKARTIFMQVLLAIKYLHDRNIVFRDIKPENVLIDAKGNAKLTDFGLAKEIRGKTNSYCGSVEYMAPEIVSKQSYSFDVDLYCMGALLYQILIGCPPFYNPNFTNNQTKYHICNSQVSFPSRMILSDKVKDLIQSLLIKNPNNRLGHFEGVDEILQHQWLSNFKIKDYIEGRIKNPFVPHLDVQNFDRQDDEYEQYFRNKIFIDIKNCKRSFNSVNFMTKIKKNYHLKSKSQSVVLIKQINNKSKSQQEFTLESPNNKEFNFSKIKSYSKKLLVNKCNPYAIQLKNKSVSQMLRFSHQKPKQIIDEKNLFKKKNFQKTVSREMDKTSSSLQKYKNILQKEGKNFIKNLNLTNSKSYTNSRKSSLHKTDSQQKKCFVSSKEKLVKIQNHQQSEIKNQTFPLENQQFYRPKQIKQKQNIDAKGLRKNGIKKKFIFSSTVKDPAYMKQNNIKFQSANSSQQKILGPYRQSIL